MAENNNLNKLITLGNLQTFLGLIRNEYKVKDVTGSTYVSVATSTGGTAQISLDETQFALATTDAHKDKKKLATNGYVDEKIATVSTNADSKISAVTATGDSKYINATAVTTANAAEVKVSAVTKAVSAATSTDTGLADAYEVQQYVTSKLTDKVTGLTVTGTAVDGKYVSLVTQTDGLVSATYANLPVSGISTGDTNIITLENGLLSTDISLQYTTGIIDSKETKVINLVGKNGKVLSTINATDFIKDGMISSGAVKTVNGKQTIVLTFNTDAGKQDLEIDATSLVDVYTISGSNNSGVTLYKGTAEVGTVNITKVATAETALKVANKLSINGVEYDGSVAVTMNKMVSGVTLTDSANSHVKLSGASVSDAGVLTIGVDETNLNTKLTAISGAISAITDGYVNSIKVSGTSNGLFTLTPSDATSGSVTIGIDDTNLNTKLTAISGAISGMDATIACSVHETNGIVNVLTGLTQENGKITGSGQTAVATKNYVDSAVTITGVTVNTKTVNPTNKSVAISISSDANDSESTETKGIIVSTSEAGAVTVKANVAAESDINALFA